jgi:trehalose/maltose transport system substrate-binding protein
MMKKISALLLIAVCAWGCSKETTNDQPATSTQTPTTGETPKPEQPKAGVTIAISCGAVGQELELCKKAAEEWATKTGNKVNVVSTPNSATDRLALYQQILGAGASDIDVFQIDVIWPGILGSHFIDLKAHSKGAEANHFEAIVQNNTIGGKLVAMPWFTDAGVLYYRKDLLEKHGAQPPTTWAELTETAKKIQDAERKAGNKQMWGYVFQGKAYEGLTCNALEWVTSFGGGTIVDASGKVDINNPKAVTAIQTAAGWIGTITPEGVLNYAEEEARGVFQSGNAVFMRNWPYAWALAQADDNLKDKVGVAALPKGGDDGRHAAALGGWQLAVSKYSKNPEIAADLALYLTSKEVQKQRAIQGSMNPTIAELYKDQEVLTATPFFGQLYDTFVNAVPRPSTATGAKYNQVSNEFFNAVYTVLSGKAPADKSLADLQVKLDEMSRGGTSW